MTDPSNSHYPSARGEDSEPCYYEITGNPCAFCNCEACAYERMAALSEDGYDENGITGPVCPECHGTCVERYTDNPCPACYGEGFIPSGEITRIRVVDDAGSGDV